MTPQIPPNASSIPSALAKWYPKLDGLKLPDELVRGMRRAFDCIYQLRDYLAGTPTGLYTSAYTNLALTTTPTIIPGLMLYLTRPGVWLVHGIVEAIIDPADTAVQIGLVVQGQTQPFPKMSHSFSAAVEQDCLSQQWMITSTTGAERVTLMGSKTGGVGISTINSSDSTLSAIWISP